MSTRLTVTAAALVAVGIAAPPPVLRADDYGSFRAAIYARAYEVREMSDLVALKRKFDVMDEHLKVGKVYLETHRDRILVDDETIEKAKRFFADRGIRTSGGITLTVDERNRFETFCYSDPEDRAWVQKVVEHTARHFDEIILDDFFFTSCKKEGEIEAKGERSWTEYRLALLGEVARDVILAPARRVNPNVRVIVKYPNWYEHFQGLGFDLEHGPQTFDAIYTGTETRDAVRSAQHLQPYHGYSIFRYFDNLRPGHDEGGWVDTFGSPSADRYAEQLWVTLFAKAPEITLFDFRQMEMPLRPALRGPWQGQGTSLDFDAVVRPYLNDDGSYAPEATFARLAGWALDKVAPVIGQLGRPVGVPSYKPFHSTGEDFLQSFVGMVGIPIELVPRFPDEARTVFLTETAKFDPDIVGKIGRHLRAGGNVVVTTGLLDALEERGIDDLVELEVLDQRGLVDEFRVGWSEPVKSPKRILIPQLRYLTNDSWSLVDAIDGPMGWPLLLDADYGQGHLYVWTIPDNFADLYVLPEPVLSRLRQTVTQDLPVRMDAPAQVSLFLYDNGTLVVESFLDDTAEVSLVAGPEVTRMRDLETGETLAGVKVPEGGGWFRPPDAGKMVFRTSVKPHSYRAFRAESAGQP
jgi:hypothetical protein